MLSTIVPSMTLGRRARRTLAALSLAALAAGCDETKAKPPAPTPHVTVAVVARKDVNLSLEAVG
ncbi:MAG TPA: hypothetical protein VK989_09125, partial [Polyangia bacterium]|nr:hypothetical protein [Polyangia bacterium]